MKTKAAVLVTLLLVAAAFTFGGASLASAAEVELVSVYVSEDLPVRDPAAALWNEATPASIPLSAQVAAKPTLPDPSVNSIRVRSLNNGEWIAFLMEWDDPSESLGLDGINFKDAVAIQFPVSEGAPPFYCMGVVGGGVNILQWRSDFQHDIVEAYPDIKDIYPRVISNIYPMAEVTTFQTARAVGNIAAQAERLTPVEDLVANGFGTLERQGHYDADGWAVWQDGSWSAVIARPMTTRDAEDAQFKAGQTLSIAFAAWDGDNGERDGRKAASSWVTMAIDAPVGDGAAPAAEGAELPFNPWLVGVLIAALWLLSLTGLFFLARRRDSDGGVYTRESQ